MNETKLTLARIFLAAAIGSLLGVCSSAQTPQSAAAFAGVAYDGIQPQANKHFIRWIWNESGTPEEYQAHLIAINTALNHSSVSFSAPMIVSEDKTISLIPIDFTKLADDPKEVLRLLAVWDRLAIQDWCFHVHLKDVNRIRPAEHLGEVGLDLEAMFPLAHGKVQLTLPIAHGAWVHAKMLSNVDGGQYLAFRGLTPGKTTLESYLSSRGASFETAKKLNAVERLGLISHVTGKPRGINYYQAQGVRPTAGRALVFITDDIFDENLNPNSNPFSSLVDSNPDGREVFVVLPNGWIEYTLFDGKGVLVSEAPMGSPKFLVSDNRVPQPFAPRLHGAISCIRCHGPNDGYQPAQNEVADRIRAFGFLPSELQADKRFEELKTVGFLYQAKQFEIDAVLQDARDGFDRRVFEVTGINDPHAAKIGCEHVTALYNGYEHVWVDAKMMLASVGIRELPKDDPHGVNTIRQLVPTGEALAFYPKESVDTLLHLATVSTVVVNNKQTEVPLKIGRRQAEQAHHTLMLQAQRVKN